MKSKIAYCLITLALVGCLNNIETSEQIKQEAETYAQELEASKDIVKVIESYVKYSKPDSNLYKYAASCNPNKPLSRDCQFAYALAEPGTKYECLFWYNCINIFPDMHESCSGGPKSDECILYRRNMHKTQVAFFDYKRFLGNDTRIKDDATFLKFVNAYTTNAGCETWQETTSSEKQVCKERIDNVFRKALKTKVHCRDFVELEYKHWLSQAYDKYKQSLDWASSSTEALEYIKDEANDFAKKYLCDMNGWQKELFK